MPMKKLQKTRSQGWTDDRWHRSLGGLNSGQKKRETRSLGVCHCCSEDGKAETCANGFQTATAICNQQDNCIKKGKMERNKAFGKQTKSHGTKHLMISYMGKKINGSNIQQGWKMLQQY